ncbi:MAG: hypothetical protein H7267_06500 [Sandarakinorhabdus sp.]|nr:hypothetical protein [Sandarakinorhabdus sp.]
MASELLGSNLFTSVYKATSDSIKTKGHSKAEPWTVLMPRLATLCGDQLETAHASALDEFRRVAAEKTPIAGSHGKFIASAADIADGASLTPAQTGLIAGLELLFHTWHFTTKGESSVWVVSVPISYIAWPHKTLAGMTQANAIGALNAASIDKFSVRNRQDIAQAAQTGLAWTLKALVFLDDLKDGSPALAALQLWFGTATTTTAELASFAATLKAGLRKIAAKLNGGTCIVTDFVPIRASGDAKDIAARGSNAFVVASEKQDVIYIEAGFFTHSAGSVFQNDARHWARIMVHEMSHRECATLDKRYGWAGISPSSGKITPADAMVNADNWAIFVAYAAGAMTATDVARASSGA